MTHEELWQIKNEMLLSISIKDRFYSTVYGMVFGEAMCIAGKVPALLKEITKKTILDKKNIKQSASEEMLKRCAPLALVFGEDYSFQKIIIFIEKYFGKNKINKTQFLGIIIYINILFRLYHYDSFQRAFDETINECKNYIPDEYKSEFSGYEFLLNKQFQSRPDKRNNTNSFQYYLLAAIYCCISQDSYESTIRTADTFTSDSNIIGSMAGAMAGLYYYKNDGFPEEWLAGLECDNYLKILFTKFNKICKIASMSKKGDRI
jgi:ADP-ribosylglycohydrolase